MLEQLKAYSLRRIHESIPRQILERVFLSYDVNPLLNNYVTLDSAISTHVLEGSVYLDVQLLAGRETTINLEGLAPFENPDKTVTLVVPRELTGFKEIIEVYRINYVVAQQESNNMVIGSIRNDEVDNRVDILIDSVTAPPVTSTTNLELIAPNTILMNLGGIIPVFKTLTCSVAIDGNLSHIPKSSYLEFGDMVVQKAKQVIYNKAIILLDRGYVERGVELSVMSDIIRNWSEAELNYRDLLKKWQKREHFFDHTKNSKLIKLITPRLI